MIYAGMLMTYPPKCFGNNEDGMDGEPHLDLGPAWGFFCLGRTSVTAIAICEGETTAKQQDFKKADLEAPCSVQLGLLEGHSDGPSLLGLAQDRAGLGSPLVRGSR